MGIKEFLLQDGTILYVGDTEDIKALYKSIARNKNTDIYPLFCHMPKFSKYRTIYGLNIDVDRHQMMIINADSCMYILLQEGFVKEHEYDVIPIKKQLPEQNDGWISCSERLPEEHKLYDITFTNSAGIHSESAIYNPYLKKWLWDADETELVENEVLAWAEKREPYQPEKI